LEEHELFRDDDPRRQAMSSSRGKATEALSEYEAALRSDPTDPELAIRIASAQEVLGRRGIRSRPSKRRARSTR